ncbi:hypothetical protein [Pseudomonas typographi]|uniref:hypothetical protein n=1 Tax=Pseudomonas typographi TaxID=2715964 RepID=UPI001683DFE0|nr:hypothetical protein [Pseudomonas typographi]MBD1590264.1 hypothetical protein [Pseudomonas typographi]
MDGGFEARNGDNILVIDSLYSNLSLKSKGSVTTGTTGAYYYVDLTLACVDPVVAFKCTSDFAYLLSQTDNGNGTWTFRFGSYSPGQTISYWLFDVPPTGGSTYGMQVFNATGSLVFDALYPYLNPTQIYQDTSGALIGSNVTLTGDAGKTYAVVQNYMALLQYVGWEDPSGAVGPSTTYNVSMDGSVAKFTSANTLVLSTLQIYYAITGSVSYSGGGGTACYLMVDVTGL